MQAVSFVHRTWPLILLSTALVVFTLRVPVRAVDRYGDYSWHFLSTRAWLNGENPYRLADALGQKSADYPAQYNLQDITTPYPPAAFPVNALFSLFDWNFAVISFLCFSISLWAVAFYLIVRYYRLNYQQTSIFLGLSLFSYPLHTGLSIGQFSAPSIACLLISWCLANDKRYVLPATLSGAASLAFKPQIGVTLIVIVILERRWNLFFYISVVYGVLTTLALSVMFAHGVLLDVQAILSSIGAVSAQQADETCCVNLRMLTRAIDISIAARVIIEVSIVSIIIAFAGAFAYRRNIPRIHIFVLVYISTILITYHRPYDLAGLLLAVGWLVSSPQIGRLKYILAAGLAIIVQPIPTTAALGYIKEIKPEIAVTLAFVWQWLVVPHATWLLLLVAASILILGFRARGERAHIGEGADVHVQQGVAT